MIADNPDPFGLGEISPIPTWVPHAEDNADYPLRYCSSKSRARAHSVHGNQPKLARKSFRTYLSAAPKAEDHNRRHYGSKEHPDKPAASAVFGKPVERVVLPVSKA